MFSCNRSQARLIPHSHFQDHLVLDNSPAAKKPRHWYAKGMVDAALLEKLELLTPVEQEAILAVAEFLRSRRGD